MGTGRIQAGKRYLCCHMVLVFHFEESNRVELACAAEQPGPHYNLPDQNLQRGREREGERDTVCVIEREREGGVAYEVAYGEALIETNFHFFT